MFLELCIDGDLVLLSVLAALLVPSGGAFLLGDLGLLGVPCRGLWLSMGPWFPLGCRCDQGEEVRRLGDRCMGFFVDGCDGVRWVRGDGGFFGDGAPGVVLAPLGPFN